MNAQQPFEYTWKIGVEYWSRRSLRRSVPGRTTCRTNSVDRTPMWFSFEDTMMLTLHKCIWAQKYPASLSIGDQHRGNCLPKGR